MTDSVISFNLFVQYGEVSALLVSKKKHGSAIVEFESPICAVSNSLNRFCCCCKMLEYQDNILIL